MNDITALSQREKFEAWLEEAEALPWGYLKKRRTSDDAYHEPNTTDMWGAWQAASVEMVEALEKAQAGEKQWREVVDAFCADDADWHKLTNSNNELIALLSQVLCKQADRIAELEGTEQKLCAANVTLDARAELAERRLAELESRTVSAPQSDYFASLVAMARVSADKAMRRFPQPNYVLLKVAEEAGEVVQAGVHYAEKRMEWQQVEGEIVQLLAMLIRLVTEGDQINGITPPAAGIQVIEGEGQ